MIYTFVVYYNCSVSVSFHHRKAELAQDIPLSRHVRSLIGFWTHAPSITSVWMMIHALRSLGSPLFSLPAPCATVSATSVWIIVPISGSVWSPLFSFSPPYRAHTSRLCDYGSYIWVSPVLIHPSICSAYFRSV